MPFESVLPTPDISAARRILCIQPHYDDNDNGAGASAPHPQSLPTRRREAQELQLRR